jgi:hypothetical protein
LNRRRAELLFIVALLVGGGLFVGLVLESDGPYRRYGGPPRTVLDVGDCVTVLGRPVDCEDPAYFFRVATKGEPPSACAAGHDRHLALDGEDYCLDRKRLVEPIGTIG